MTHTNPEWLEHQLRRWMRPDAHRFVRSDWRRHVRPGFEHDHPFALYEQKYRPDQPRVPAGNPDGGEWTADASGHGLAAASNAVTNNKRPRIPVVPAAWPSNGPPPEIPKDRPITSAERTRLTKIAAIFIGGSVRKLLMVLATAYWLYSERHNILSFADPPKTLKELQDNASSPQPGYEIHHIVEQTPAAKEGYSRSQIDDPDNLVRVPTYKHRSINSWYSTKSDDFGGISPRDYLRGRSWEEKRKMGLSALRQFGVLKP